VLHGRDPVHESRAPASLLRATLDRDIMGDIGWHRRGIIVNHRVGTSFKGHERNGAKVESKLSHKSGIWWSAYNVQYRQSCSGEYLLAMQLMVQ
jgi:hypothetical protein